MPNQHDIYVRAHTVQVNEPKAKGAQSEPDTKWPQYALVFDCESRITADQTLTFGVWRFCALRNGTYAALEEGIFHEDSLTAKEMDVLRKVCTRSEG